MERFLVKVECEVDEIPAIDRERVLMDERAHGIAFRESGTIERIWRVKGSSGGSFGIWLATDEGELLRLLSSLPIAPWSTFDVVPLEEHPLERHPLNSSDVKPD